MTTKTELQKREMKDTIIGTIVEAGRDHDGKVRLVIYTGEEDVKQLADLPLYAPVLITIRRVEKENAE